MPLREEGFTVNEEEEEEARRGEGEEGEAELAVTMAPKDDFDVNNRGLVRFKDRLAEVRLDGFEDDGLLVEVVMVMAAPEVGVCGDAIALLVIVTEEVEEEVEVVDGDCVDTADAALPFTEWALKPVCGEPGRV